MDSNILDKLRLKEEEMEALVKEARDRAQAMKEEAIRRSKEIRDAAAREGGEAEREACVREEAEIREAVSGMEERAREEARRLKVEASRRMEMAVRKVMEIVLGALDDKGDDEGPDHRAKKPSR